MCPAHLRPRACPGDSRDTRESPDPFGEAAPGGYRKRLPDDYDRALCLLPRDLFDFLYATQPREWERLKQQHGGEVKERFLDRYFCRLATTILAGGASGVGTHSDPAEARFLVKRPVAGPIEALSAIIRELNERFGTDFTPEDKIFIRQLEEQLAGDPSLTASVRVNTPENARLTFDHVVNDRLQELVDTNFKFYKKVTDDRDFAKYFLDWLFRQVPEGGGVTTQ